MISYTWLLSTEQPIDKKTLFELQALLLSAGVFLNLTWKDDTPQMTIAVAEDLIKRAAALKIQEATADTPIHDTNLPVNDPPKRRRGRPSVKPTNDITLASVYHKRFMGLSMEDIAKSIGVSRRTLYRKWEKISDKNIDPDTPFSQW